MTSKEIKEIYENKEIDKLYAQCKKQFDLIDTWAKKFVEGDLLSEYELKYAQQQLNGCQTILNPIAGAFEAMVVEYENNYILQEETKFKNLRVQDKDHCKAFARSQVSDLRRYASDFTRYTASAQSNVITAQSLLKRQTVEKSNKEIDYTGEQPNLDNIANPVDNSQWDT
ncbi:MAG: hypothetical protein PVG65_00050 [Candidatus Thorarchaeota archaeon]|jgi:hypothetical protein